LGVARLVANIRERDEAALSQRLPAPSSSSSSSSSAASAAAAASGGGTKRPRAVRLRLYLLSVLASSDLPHLTRVLQVIGSEDELGDEQCGGGRGGGGGGGGGGRPEIAELDSASDGGESDAADEGNGEPTRAQKIRDEASRRQQVRRKKGKAPRTVKSVWKLVGMVDKGDEGLQCVICSTKITIPNSGSSSNIALHYKNMHLAVYNAIDAAGSELDKKNVIVAAVNKVQKDKKEGEASIKGFFKPVARGVMRTADKVLVRRVAGVVLVAVKQVPMTLLGSEEMEAFVAAAGGHVDSSKTPYLDLLPEVHDVVNDLWRAETTEVRSGSLTYDGWGAKDTTPVAGLTFNYIDKAWNARTFPVSFFDTRDAAKTGMGHAAILRAATKDNPRLGEDVLIFSGTTDNEPAVALGMDIFLGFTGGLRCTVHSLGLVVNDVANTHRYLDELIVEITNITSYVNQRPKVGRLLHAAQLEVRPADRIMALEKLIQTRWHNKLAILENHIILVPELVKVLPEDAPPVLNKYQQGVAAEMVLVLGEVRRVSRILEADRILSGPRAPPLLWSLAGTLRLLGGGGIPEALPPSTSVDDVAMATVRAEKLSFKEAKVLARALADGMDERIGHFYRPVSRDFAKLDFEGMEEEEMKTHRKQCQALVLHMAAIFDVNECTLEWVPESQRDAYYDLLYTAIDKELPTLLATYDMNCDYVPWIRTMHRALRTTLASGGRHDANFALDWWRELTSKSMEDLFKNAALVDAVRLVDAARPFLSTQASSASAERMFSDAGYINAYQRQSMPMFMLEMLLVIRAFVQCRVESVLLTSVVQSDLHSARAERILVVSREIANAIAAKRQVQAEAISAKARVEQK